MSPHNFVSAFLVASGATLLIVGIITILALCRLWQHTKARQPAPHRHAWTGIGSRVLPKVVKTNDTFRVTSYRSIHAYRCDCGEFMVDYRGWPTAMTLTGRVPPGWKKWPAGELAGRLMDAIAWGRE